MKSKTAPRLPHHKLLALMVACLCIGFDAVAAETSAKQPVTAEDLKIQLDALRTDLTNFSQSVNQAVQQLNARDEEQRKLIRQDEQSLQNHAQQLTSIQSINTRSDVIFKEQSQTLLELQKRLSNAEQRIGDHERRLQVIEQALRRPR